MSEAMRKLGFSSGNESRGYVTWYNQDRTLWLDGRADNEGRSWKAWRKRPDGKDEVLCSHGDMFFSGPVRKFKTPEAALKAAQQAWSKKGRPMQVGDKIKMEGEERRYTVMAADARFAILVKPFNARKTYLYTITDLERKERGRCDLIFGPPARLDTADGAAEALSMLQTGEMSVSRRRCVPLTLDEISQLQSK